jgi:hypothetical protein
VSVSSKTYDVVWQTGARAAPAPASGLPISNVAGRSVAVLQ